MVGRVARGRTVLAGAVVDAAADCGEGSGDQVVHESDALGRELHGAVGQQQVVVNQRRAVRNLDEDILAGAVIAARQGVFIERKRIVVEEVLGHAGALCLPVEPEASGAVVDMVPAVDHVDRRVHLDAADLGACQILPVVDMVDMIVLDDGEHAAQMADDAGLAAVVDVASADDVRTDLLFGPAFPLRLQDAVALGLRAVFQLLQKPLVVIFGLQIFAQRDAGALGIRDFAVFDDPAFGPVRADHAFLVSGRRRPLGSGAADCETGEGDVADTFLRGIEAVPADVDLDVFSVRIRALEIGPDQGLIRGFVLLGVPGIDCEGGIPGLFVNFRFEDLLKGSHFVEGFPVQVDFAGMGDVGGDVPVAADEGGIGVVISEYPVRDSGKIDVPLIFLPVFDDFGTGDHSLPGLDAAVDDPLFFRTGLFRIDIFAVDARRYQNFIAGAGDRGGLGYIPEGIFFCAVSASGTVSVYIDLHRIPPISWV